MRNENRQPAFHDGSARPKRNRRQHRFPLLFSTRCRWKRALAPRFKLQAIRWIRNAGGIHRKRFITDAVDRRRPARPARCHRTGRAPDSRPRICRSLPATTPASGPLEGRLSNDRTLPPSGQAKYCPPLAEIVEPVMKPASSEARKTTQRATSSGSPRRPTGI